MRIPPRGLSKDDILRQLEDFAIRDFQTHSGKSYAYTFDAGADASAIAKEAFTRYMSKSGLDPTFYPSVLELENRVVAMAAAHLGGSPQTVGTFTSGGTESIMLAVKSARDYFRHVRPDIERPEVLLPVTAHAAFQKAAHYLGLQVSLVDVDHSTFRVRPEAVEARITPNTILLVGSASCYAYGVVDPIPELGRIAKKHGLLLHVDGCIGGFVLPYFKELGADIPDFDLSVPGVTSLSMDFHKYCYAPKGASVVLYNSAELRRHQIFACATWTGYTIVNTSVQSTKGAGALAGTWAVLSFLGQDGYRRIAKDLLDTKREIVEGIESIPRLRLLGRPDMPLVAFTSDSISVFHIIDDMSSKGWYVQPQLRFGDYEECIHLSINPSNVPHTSALLADLRATCEKITAKPRGKAAKAARAMLGVLGPDRISDDAFGRIIGLAGMKEVGIPERMADINDIMNALPPKLSERLLVEFINRLFVLPGAGNASRVELPSGPRFKGGSLRSWLGRRFAWRRSRRSSL